MWRKIRQETDEKKLREADARPLNPESGAGLRDHYRLVESVLTFWVLSVPFINVSVFVWYEFKQTNQNSKLKINNKEK